MARTTYRLTAVKIAALKEPGLHPDGDGLYLRVTKTGTKSWMLRYWVDGKARDMGLGPLSTVTLAKARELAGGVRVQRRDGIDPIKRRIKEREEAKRHDARGMTFKEAALALIASHEPAWRNAKHREQWRNSLATYVYPIMGDVPVDEVDTTLVLQVLNPLWKSKTETATRVRGRIEGIIDWAKARGARQGDNPARWRGHLDHLLPSPGKIRRVRHHPALPYADVPSFMAELRTKSGTSARALEFVILSAARTNEALGAIFEEIDTKQAVWTVPAERMKAGREHRVPLPPRAITVVKEMAELRRSEFIFPGFREGRPLSNMAMLELLRDMRPGITTHGFRSSFRDWAAEETATPSEVVEMALAHAIENKVEAAYRRGDLFDKRRKLMEAWASYCTQDVARKPARGLLRRVV